MERKKYMITYRSGATGYGWDEKCNTINQVIKLIKGLKEEYTAEVTVYDCDFRGFIFYKKSLAYNFDIDYIFTNKKRDLRTKERVIKRKVYING